MIRDKDTRQRISIVRVLNVDCFEFRWLQVRNKTGNALYTSTVYCAVYCVYPFNDTEENLEYCIIS